MKRKPQKPKDHESTVVPILRKITITRKAQAFFMRKTTANLMELLTEAELDAMMEITLAHKIMAGNLNYRQCRYGEVMGAPVEEFSAFAFDLITRYRDWSREMTRQNPEALGVCIAVCVEEESLSAMAKYRAKRREKILIMLKEGFEQWLTILRKPKVK